MSIDEMCEVVRASVKDRDVAATLMNILKAGHECRTALISLCPESDLCWKVVDEYDRWWLGVPSKNKTP